MNPIRKRLLRYQAHELIRMGKVMVLTLLALLCISWLFSEKANAESGYYATVQRLNKVTKLYLKEQRDYYNCLTNQPVGEDENGNALFCNVSPLEIKI